MDLLSVNPKLLTFYAPYDRCQKRKLTLLNPYDRQVLFKVKSNASLHYHVSPSSGSIEPYCFSDISISLNNFDFHEDLEQKHHFCIQSMYAPREYINGETTLAIFQRVSRSDISSKSIFVRLEAKPFSSPNLRLDLLSSLGKIPMERDMQLCPNFPNSLEASQQQGKPKKSGHITKLVIIGSMILVVFTAYMQRKQVHEMLVNNFTEIK
ncbi:vesicle-associated membrane protein-associated protein B [Drosophila gunungcola]|uniref:vesicle-associated membrane protein-associated protein B n=1 Tax=Drosophila gunungcola TaxID=103775 RepID=UPI0022E07AC6|nr:vesicle-associated membrane protein-associated protein B [Drosophila gunungcola]